MNPGDRGTGWSGQCEKETKGPEMEFEEQRVKEKNKQQEILVVY